MNIRPTGAANSAPADPASIKFSSGERLDRTTIDNTGLVNPNASALAKASDATLLRAKLEGVTREETKITPATSGASKNVYIGYIGCGGGNEGKYIYGSSSYRTIFVPLPEGTRRVRFYGRTTNGDIAYGYAFANTVDVGSLVATSTDESPKDISQHIMEKHAFDNTGTNGFKEYVVDVPEGAACFCTLYSGLSLTSSNFYCYLQTGETISELTEKLMNGYEEETTEEIELYNSGVCFGKPDSNYPNEYVCYKDSNTSNVRSGYVGANRVREAKLHGGRIVFRKEAYEYQMRVTFTAKIIDKSMTFNELSEGGYLSSIHDGSTNPYKWYDSDGEWREVVIPEDCYNIYFTKAYYGGMNNHSNESGSIDRRPNEVRLVTTRHREGTVERTNNLIGTLVEDLYGKEATEESDGMDYANTFKGMSIDNPNNQLHTNTYIDSVCAYVNVEGCSSITIGPSVNICYFFIAKRKVAKDGSKTDAEVQADILAEGCEGYVKKNGHYMMKMEGGSEAVTIKLTEEAKYVYFQVKYHNDDIDHTPGILLLRRTARREGKIDRIFDGTLRLRHKEKDDSILVTAPIPLGKGVYLSVREPYRIGNGYLVEHVTGRIVNDDFRALEIKANTSEEYRRASVMRMLPPFDVVYEIARTDGGAITSTDEVVEEFAIVDEMYRKKMPSGIEESIYYAFKRKLQTSMGNVWTPLRKVQHSGGGREKRFRKGVTYVGVPYSGPTQWGKHVGIEVSMRTFKTALANPRSVMYTEVLATYTNEDDTTNSATAQSAYGLTHGSYPKEAGAYYGCVCTGLTSYLYGLDHVMKSICWKADGTAWGSGVFDIVMRGSVPDAGMDAKIIAGGTQYDYGNKANCQTLAEMLEPMDFIWRAGHCMVISDIYVDDYGAVKYIVVAEQTTPTSTANAYTPEFFFLKFLKLVTGSNPKAWQVLRRKSDAAWTAEAASIPRQGMDAELCIVDKSQYTPEDMGEIDPDITTFAGEYATFVIGDPDDTTNNFKLYLNIHRGGEGGYTHLQIFGEDADAETDTPIDDIDISENGGNVDQPTILAEDIADDWIRFNLAAWWNANHQNAVGKFKAKVVRKEEEVVVETSEGFTHFEMVSIEIGIVEGGTFWFRVKGGVPVLFRCEEMTGLIADDDVVELGTDNYTVNNGVYSSNNLNIPNAWLNADNATHIRLFVKTDYGMANMRMRLVSG